jgi:hypothetical protein
MFRNAIPTPASGRAQQYFQHPELELIRYKIHFHLGAVFQIEQGRFDIAAVQAQIQDAPAKQQATNGVGTPPHCPHTYSVDAASVPVLG